MPYIYTDIEDAERFEWAINPETTAEVLTNLADDPRHTLRQYVAQHANTPPEIVERLVDDPDPITGELALLNPNLPLPRMLAEADGPRAHILAKNPALTEQVIHQMLNYTGAFTVAVLRHIANHPNTPPEIVEQLAETADPRIRETARRRLATS